MRPFSTSLSLALVVALAGCGPRAEGGGNGQAPTQTGGAASASAANDPCSLVTADEVSQILDDKIVAARAGEGSCTYETEDPQAASVTVELDQTDAAGQMDVVRRAAGLLKGMGEQAAKQGAAGEDVNAMLRGSGEAPKVGDEAFFGANTQLSVRKGNSYIAIQPPIMRSRKSGGNPLLNTDDKKKIAVAVAQKAVSRLP
jgi:hypothetical protein